MTQIIKIIQTKLKMVLNRYQNFPLLLCFLLICLFLLIFWERLSFLSLESTCFTFLPSLPLADLNLFVTTYFFLSFNPLFYLSYNFPTCLSLLISSIPY